MSKLRERLDHFFFVFGIAPRRMRALLALERAFQARGFIGPAADTPIAPQR
jgi:hypothetical protein